MSTGAIHTGIEFFVAADGDDASPGTLEQPFATLTGARDAVREALKAARETLKAWEAKTSEQVINLPLIWRFRTDPNNEGEAARWYDAAAGAEWETIRTDLSWTAQGHEYRGSAWYSVEISAPKLPADRRALLHFGAVDGQCWMWLDGKPVGSHTGPPEQMWDQPFDIDIGDAIRPGKVQRLVVKVVKNKDAAGIWQPVALRLAPTSPGEAPRPLPITVWIRGGKYYPERTLHLTEADSGTADAPITYAAYPGETPLISGGRRVIDWKPYRGSIYVSEMPETKGRGLFFRQLFANGQRQVRSRYPKLDSSGAKWNGRWAYSRADDAALESMATDPYIVWDEPDAFQHPWSKPTQGEVFLMPCSTCWGDSCLIRIRSVDPERGIIRLAHGMRDFDVNPFYVGGLRRERCQFIIENLLEELTSPGEWCLDTEDGRLYFWPEGGAIEGLEVVIPVVKCLVHLEGASHVRISGLTFTETRGGEPSSHYDDMEGLGPMRPSMGWEYCGETIYMSKCASCRVENCRIVNVGGNGIYLRNHNEMNVISRNEISHIGANGVVLAGGRINIFENLTVMSGITGGTDIAHPVFNEISDNIIHHTGLVDTYSAGVFLGLGNWNRVAHNDIHDVPHHAINLGNSRYGRNYVEYNRITRAAQVTNDTGAINCWHEMPPEMEPPGHVIRYNWISDTGNAAHGATVGHFAYGIYLDNWSSNCIVHGNIIVHHQISLVAKGRNNTIQNNIFVNCSKCHIVISSHASYPAHAAVVLHNIFCDTSDHNAIFIKLAKRPSLRTVLLECDGNLFFRTGDDDPLIAKGERPMQPLLGEGVRLSEWRRISGREGDAYDVNSLVGDPLFVDAAGGDYRLRPESPALALGFQPIPLEHIGVRRQA
jgi:parallel beta-helix repeat protein